MTEKSHRNVSDMKVVDLQKLATKLGILDDLKKKKGGYVPKFELVLAIEDYYARHHKKDKIVIKSPKTSKSPSPKKKSSPKTPPSKKVSPKGSSAINVNSLKLPEVIKELKKYPKYKNLTDYVIKKQLGKDGKLALIKDLRLELLDLQARSTHKTPEKITLKSPSPKKKPLPKAPSPKPKISPKKKPLPKKPSPKKISPKKLSPKTSPKKLSPKKYSPKEVSPKKSPPKKMSPSTKTTLNCKNRKSYKGKYCNTKTGKHIAKNNDGKPRGVKTLKEEFGNDFVINEKYGLVGTQEDVNAHIKYWKKEKKSSPKKVSPKKISPKKKSPSPKKASPKKKSPSPKKASPKKKRGCGNKNMKDFEGYTKCDSNKLCNVLTGNCIADTNVNKKGKHVLTTKEGRRIIGDLETIKKLQPVLGGNIAGEQLSKKSPIKKSPSPKKKSPSPERTKKHYIKGKRPKTPSPVKVSPPKTHKSPLSKKGSSEVPTEKPGILVTAEREKIWDEFTKCLQETAGK